MFKWTLVKDNCHDSVNNNNNNFKLFVKTHKTLNKTQLLNIQ